MSVYCIHFSTWLSNNAISYSLWIVINTEAFISGYLVELSVKITQYYLSHLYNTVLNFILSRLKKNTTSMFILPEQNNTFN